MRLVVTDIGLIWNHGNPILKKYKDIVLVVCLNGKKVTDEYECFVSPYKTVGMGIDKFGVEDRRFRALASVGENLNSVLGYHDDIVFLADNAPSSLYPFYVIKELNEFNRLHLLAMPPLLGIESKARIRGYAQMLSDLSGLASFLYCDINEILKKFDKRKTLPELFEYVQDEFGRLMPCILNGIYHMKETPCYFDFASKGYVPLRDGFKSIDIKKKNEFVSDIDFPVTAAVSILGNLCLPSYSGEGEDVKKEIERPVARVDGKKVCNVLREQRIRLAAANNIPFESEECPSIGACAGTCEKCEKEADYLREQMQMIPEEKRIYPQFDPAGEASL